MYYLPPFYVNVELVLLASEPQEKPCSSHEVYPVLKWEGHNHAWWVQMDQHFLYLSKVTSRNPACRITVTFCWLKTYSNQSIIMVVESIPSAMSTHHYQDPLTFSFYAALFHFASSTKLACPSRSDRFHSQHSGSHHIPNNGHVSLMPQPGHCMVILLAVMCMSYVCTCKL